MRDKLIELVLDYCTAPGKYASLGDERRFPYKTTELKKYSNEYLLELLEDFLEYKSLDITAVDNTYSEDVGMLYLMIFYSVEKEVILYMVI